MPIHSQFSKCLCLCHKGHYSNFNLLVHFPIFFTQKAGYFPPIFLPAPRDSLYYVVGFHYVNVEDLFGVLI